MNIMAQEMKRTRNQFMFFLVVLSFIFWSCSSDEDNEDEIRELKERIEELEYELEEANSTIQEYEDKLDNIQFEARQGYDAISFFNWSFELQEALDAFERIQYEASY